MKLSLGESLIFIWLRSAEEVQLDELVRLTGSSRNSLVVRLKYLSAKVAQEGWIIRRTSSVGRGKRAIYAMGKRF